jgi:hypothetical protein
MLEITKGFMLPPWAGSLETPTFITEDHKLAITEHGEIVGRGD